MDGDTYFVIRRGRTGHRVLVNTASADARAACRSFPFPTFERAIFSMLAEVQPHDVMGREDGPDEVQILSGELARVEAKIAELEAELLKVSVATLSKVLARLEVDKADLVAKLAHARQKAVHPLSEAWGAAKSLLATLDGAPDPTDARLRLRSALRRLVEGIWLVVVPRGRDRVAAVQVQFAAGGRRNFVIFHRPAHANASARRESCWWARSLVDTVALGGLDLRIRAHAERLERALLAADLKEINE
jgi:hypothetical protein